MPRQPFEPADSLDASSMAMFYARGVKAQKHESLTATRGDFLSRLVAVLQAKVPGDRWHRPTTPPSPRHVAGAQGSRSVGRCSYPLSAFTDVRPGGIGAGYRPASQPANERVHLV